MTVLITGGIGKTGSKILQLLHQKNFPVLIASRSGIAPEPFKAVKCDWYDQTTFENPFKIDSSIDRIYIISPPVLDSLPIVKPFIDLAVSKGVKRVVHGSSSAVDKGDVNNGKVHEYLVNSGVDYIIIRPTRFIENLGTFSLSSIRDKDEITSVTNDERIAFVGVNGIEKSSYSSTVINLRCPPESLQANTHLYCSPKFATWSSPPEEYP